MKRFVMTASLIALTLTGQTAYADDIVDTAVSNGNFKTLVAAVNAAGLVDTLKSDGPFTVFAPTDEAFAKLPKGTLKSLLKPENKQQLIDILTYHVVGGRVAARDAFGLTSAATVNGQQLDIMAGTDGIRIDNAKIVATDVQTSNGVIHVIDTVLLPSSKNIPATATAAGKFNTLLAAAKAAGLVDALSGDGPLTVFAPTDDAFAKLPKGTVENLLKAENRDKLQAILKFHVVPGRVFARDAVKAGKAKTLQGQKLEISVAANGVSVNGSRVVAADIEASNGVIHVIDAVMLPGMTRTSARELIEQAIADGSRQYNAGHAKACAALYRETLESLMTGVPGEFSDHETQVMRTAMKRFGKTHHAGQRAWMMRQTLEMAYTSLAH